MDLIKFEWLPDKPNIKYGKILNNINSMTWIERYLEAGEFTITTTLASGLIDELPLGTLISHTKSSDLMIVENHFIEGNSVTITGRGFESYLENRIVGSNATFPLSGNYLGYTLVSNYIWDQAVYMLKEHLYTDRYITPSEFEEWLLDSDNEIPGLYIRHTIADGETSDSQARHLDIQPLYDAVLSLLEEDDLGLRVVRPGVRFFFDLNETLPADEVDDRIKLLVHSGVDKTDDINFTEDKGMLTNTSYLWSDVGLKTAALIKGRWVQTYLTKGPTKYDRRVALIDASHLDEHYSTAPTGGTLNTVVARMQEFANQELAKHKSVELTEFDVSGVGAPYLYRRDYNIGDIVSVTGRYNTEKEMRVIEYAETEDDQGYYGYPTLGKVYKKIKGEWYVPAQ